MKKRFAALAACCALLCGCAAEGGQSMTSSAEISSESSDESALPFEDNYPETSPDTPLITYLGSRELKNSRAVVLYKKAFAADYAAFDVVAAEYISPERLGDELAARVASDRSPDLTDKLSNSFPYLMSKNCYADLTEYIDVSAPQWEGYVPYIEYYQLGKKRYFYPEKVVTAPRFLVYSKTRFALLGLNDPEELFEKGEWTWNEFAAAAESFAALTGGAGVYGEYLADCFVSSTGETVFAVSENGMFSNNLGCANIERAFKFAKNELSAKGLVGSVGGYSAGSFEALESGAAGFKLTNDAELAKFAADNPDFDCGAVPFPKDPEADEYYGGAECTGFLVPRGAKNIKGAASFINCGRLAEAGSGEGFLDKAREKITPVPDEHYCFDSETNSAVASLLHIAVTSGAAENAAAEYAEAVNKALDATNANIE